ncbi:MAG: endonuclease III domain-containing protein [Thermomicrobiales bacterium]
MTFSDVFDIDHAMNLVRDAVRDFPKAAMFELADDGHNSLFEQLIACLLSVRTYDEVSITAARQLFERAATPAELEELPVDQIDALIDRVTFHERKAVQIKEIAHLTNRDHAGQLPCDPEILLAFDGIGPKCTNLALGIACGAERISVDIHVHRVTNRWGYISATRPELTLVELERKLPRTYWLEINALLVPFGKHICTGIRPKCSTCPLSAMCRQVGVTSHR